METVIYGAGVMAQLTKEAVEKSGNSVLAMIDPLGNGDYENLKTFDKKCDVIIDFSHFTSLEDILEYAVDNKTPVIIATTGHTKEQTDKILKASSEIPILKTTNTSLGVSIVNEILSYATKLLRGFDIELIEKHHNRKIDAPSGTANTMLEVIRESLDKEMELVYGREGHKKREENEIGVHVIRAGNIVGEHSVIFSKGDEVIEIKHEALSRRIFADGAADAANKLINKKNGLYSMKDLLNI
ncbi:MAG: 4-hydroxy-tetrahydrodipicolinate reductase [Sebaldella sp.]|nr:4-hydroxy-tetrahydrodipicolinate reductase [Sebaldella sp.]